MKLGLISDIHGDFQSLQQVWSRLVAAKVDRIVCAGDLVDHGPDPDRVVSFVMEQQILAVRGNHDRWALQRGPFGIDEFGGPTPSRATLDELERLPPFALIAEMSRVGVIVHGSPSSDMEFVNPHTHSALVLEGYLSQLNADLLVFGHTHKPAWYRGSKGLVVNPGSIASIPNLESSRSYAIVDLEALSVTFYKVETGEEVLVRSWCEPGD